MTRSPSRRYTQTVYSLIGDGKHADAIRILTFEVSNFPRSRAALSLLGYCHYQVQDYHNAAQVRQQQQQQKQQQQMRSVVVPAK